MSDANTPNHPAPLGGGKATDANSIEAVRDLLFGQELTTIDRKFAEVEQRLFSRISSVQSTMMRRLEELEEMVASGLKAQEEKQDRERHETTIRA